MFISTYNNNGLNDVLMLVFQKEEPTNQEVIRNESIAQIKNKKTGEIVGINVFNSSTILPKLTNGPVDLSEEDLNVLNSFFKTNDVAVTLDYIEEPKFVVGYVKTCEPVEGSDHLNVTQTVVDNDKELQIVCGASNISQGQKVVVAKVGAIMPDGLVIWPGKLKGVESEGMICSARELNLKQEADGILVLDDETKVGTEFVTH